MCWWVCICAHGYILTLTKTHQHSVCTQGSSHKLLCSCVCTDVCDHVKPFYTSMPSSEWLCFSNLGHSETREVTRRGLAAGAGEKRRRTLNCFRPTGPGKDRGHPNLHTDRLGHNLRLWRLPSCDSGLRLGPLSDSSIITRTCSWHCSPGPKTVLRRQVPKPHGPTCTSRTKRL